MKTVQIKNSILFNGACLEVMDYLINQGIKVDAIITDPPYQTTQNSWDVAIDKSSLACRFRQLRKDKSTPIILFGSEPFATSVRTHYKDWYKYDWYWLKDRPSGHLNAKKQPMRNIENIMVFYEKQCNYNPQMVEGNPNHKRGNSKPKTNNYNDYRGVETEGTLKYPKQVLEFSRPHPPIHPTQKPVALLEYLVRTYTNEHEVVLDFTMGSGTTGVACQNLNRKFIGIELKEKYFEIAVNRIKGDL